MALVNLTRNPETLQGFELASKADMDIAADWLMANGYNQVSVTGWVEGSPAVVKWQLSYSDPYGLSQIGYLGDWIVLQNGNRATIHRPDRAAAIFSIAP